MFLLILYYISKLALGLFFPVTFPNRETLNSSQILRLLVWLILHGKFPEIWGQLLLPPSGPKNTGGLGCPLGLN